MPFCSPIVGKLTENRLFDTNPAHWVSLAEFGWVQTWLRCLKFKLNLYRFEQLNFYSSTA